MPVPDHFRLIGRMICKRVNSVEDLKTEKRLETSTAERRSAGFTFNHGFNAKRGIVNTKFNIVIKRVYISKDNDIVVAL